MIAYLKGRLMDLAEEALTLEVSGVGYEVHVSRRASSELMEKLERELELWIYTHVREDALQLFGFQSRFEKALFLSLLKVNGVGPKMAVGILSGATPEKIREWIDQGDVKSLVALPKLGKKTAEQIVLTLKGKLVFMEEERPQKPVVKYEAVRSALMNLGFKPALVGEFVEGLEEGVEFEQGVRRGLLALGQSGGS